MIKEFKQLALVYIVSFFMAPTFSHAEPSPASFNSIVSTLNPLDMVDNIDGVRRSINLNIQFNAGSYELLPEGKKQLDMLGKALNSKRLAEYGFLLVGHTDATGDKETNQRLSKDRAAAAALYLFQESGVSPFRIEIEGRGESDLLAKLADNDKRHRRVEVIAIKLQDYFETYTTKAAEYKNQEQQNKLMKSKSGNLGGIKMQSADSSASKKDRVNHVNKETKIVW